MKIGLSVDEWYPVFEPEDGDEFEVPTPTVKRWQRVMAEFQKVQDEMEALQA